MGSRKIVIINDDKKSSGDIEGILAVSGHDPIVVNDAFLAVDTVVQKKPDVILLELKMPRKNGFELADEINRVFEPKKIPIIAMSTFFKDEFRFLFNLCGINRYIKKPFYPLDIIWAIESVTEESNELIVNNEEKSLETVVYRNYDTAGSWERKVLEQKKVKSRIPHPESSFRGYAG